MAYETNTRSWNSCVALMANPLSLHFSNFVPLSRNSSNPGSLQTMVCSSRFQNWTFKHWMNPVLSVSSLPSEISLAKNQIKMVDKVLILIFMIIKKKSLKPVVIKFGHLLSIKKNKKAIIWLMCNIKIRIWANQIDFQCTQSWLYLGRTLNFSMIPFLILD